MNILHRFLATATWVQIFISPFILGLVLGALSWYYLPEWWGLGLGILGALLGGGAGIWLAEKARRSTGTIEFMSRTRSHPELRHEEK
ncbi:hypothetical protein [Hymenobacter chitinivorans]|uniref:Uncharacterized protein n=1 Tax=Hymenobacter chitinivorans DSM 11115 TaxID=1121954 RepID=A0A2M9BAB3_9BACT|nr:hypothetical protein [Hymenobacter chitinivorans]PJJ54883.1 hypothetical protein CLV45_3229 [Hymenobacter chitinivorans DSM 11115]